MNRQTMIAVAVQIVAMLSIAVPPFVVARTGTVVYLETEKMDPRALFRGDYVILGYREAQGVVTRGLGLEAASARQRVYVSFTTDRPGQFVDVSLEPPDPTPGQVCVVGRVRRFSWQPAAGGEDAASVDFPQIAQYFVPEGEGRELEAARGEDLLARIAVNEGCNAVLLGLEAR